MLTRRLAWSLLLLIARGAAAATDAPLSAFVAGRPPWGAWNADSEQRRPVYLGLSPLQLATGLSTAPPTDLPASLREAGEAQAAALTGALRRRSVELEAWPARDDEGRLVWAFARWRDAPSTRWTWLDASSAPAFAEPAPFLPRLYRTSQAAPRRAVFADESVLDGLYDKPVFGDCLWTRPDGTVAAAWLPPGRRAAAAARPPTEDCRVLPQPADLDGRPASFVLPVADGRVAWPEALVWMDTATLAAGEAPAPPPLDFPTDLAARLRADVRALDGEDDLSLAGGRRLRLTRKSAAQPDNQLSDVVGALERRYALLGIKTRRLRADWRGRAVSDLIAVIPGSLPPAENRPVLLVDHIDTAFAEDVFRATRERRAVPGADDDACATATLLQAAAVLRHARPRHDIWLAHLTGEEYPTDDLGARALVRELLAERKRLTGAIVLDMIGHRDPGDPVFQLSAGQGRASERLARAAEIAARREAPGLAARLRGRFDPESYLYNTDALIFSEAGYPALLVNEHLNAGFHLERLGYHDTTDVAAGVDFDYAAALARTAIAAAAAMAGVGDPGPRLPAGHLAVPLVRQAAPYTCGAAVMASVLAYWGVYDGGEAGLYQKLQTTQKDGTDPRAMADAARSFGLDAAWRERTTLEDLRAALARGQTVILDLQAWRENDPTPETWEDNWEDGHYAVLVGMDDRYLYVMDPSAWGSYASVPIDELDERWHDYESRRGPVWRDWRLAIFVSGRGTPPASYPWPLGAMR